MDTNAQVRKAIDDTGMTMYALAKVSGVSQSMLSRFMRGERDLTLRTLDRLGPVIGVRLVVDRPTKHRNAKGG